MVLSGEWTGRQMPAGQCEDRPVDVWMGKWGRGNAGGTPLARRLERELRPHLVPAQSALNLVFLSPWWVPGLGGAGGSELILKVCGSQHGRTAANVTSSRVGSFLRGGCWPKGREEPAGEGACLGSEGLQFRRCRSRWSLACFGDQEESGSPQDNRPRVVWVSWWEAWQLWRESSNTRPSRARTQELLQGRCPVKILSFCRYSGGCR